MLDKYTGRVQINEKAAVFIPFRLRTYRAACYTLPSRSAESELRFRSAARPAGVRSGSGSERSAKALGPGHESPAESQFPSSPAALLPPCSRRRPSLALVLALDLALALPLTPVLALVPSPSSSLSPNPSPGPSTCAPNHSASPAQQAAATNPNPDPDY